MKSKPKKKVAPVAKKKAAKKRPYVKTDRTKLNEKQQAFCKRYILDWNGTRSYLETYGNKSHRAASVGAAYLLRNPNVQAFIERLKENLAEVAELSPLKVLLEHKKMAFASVANLHLSWIERKDFEQLPQDQKDCIQELATSIRIVQDKEKGPTEVEYVKIKLYDKQKSLEAINKMLGWDAPKQLDVTTLGDKITPIIIDWTGEKKESE